MPCIGSFIILSMGCTEEVVGAVDALVVFFEVLFVVSQLTSAPTTPIATARKNPFITRLPAKLFSLPMKALAVTNLPHKIRRQRTRVRMRPRPFFYFLLCSGCGRER